MMPIYIYSKLKRLYYILLWKRFWDKLQNAPEHETTSLKGMFNLSWSRLNPKPKMHWLKILKTFKDNS